MKKVISLALFILVLYSCQKDFVVKNIKDQALTVNAPANNLTTPVNQVTFWWELLDGAEKYNIQVVKPSFAAVAQLIADTNVIGNKLNLSLNPGVYQWRIRGTNAGGSTAYQVFNLKIDSTTNLTNQVVVPIAPASGTITNTKTFNFTWNALPAAVNYSIEISLNNAVVNYSLISATNYAYTFTVAAGQNYAGSWRVKALNANSISQYNTPRTFTIDLAAPGTISSPLTPTANALVRDTTYLKWNVSTATDRAYDSLFIYTDVNFSFLARTTTVSASQIKINAINTASPLPAGTTSATAIPYWWRLKTVDNVGNSTGFGSSLTFSLVQ